MSIKDNTSKERMMLINSIYGSLNNSTFSEETLIKFVVTKFKEAKSDKEKFKALVLFKKYISSNFIDIENFKKYLKDNSINLEV